MKKICEHLSVPMMILLNFFCFASSAESISDIRESAKRLANGALSKVQESAKQDMTHKPDPLGPSVGEAINHNGTNLPETQYSNGNMYDAAKAKADDKNNTEAQIAGTAFLRQKEYPITHNDSILDKAKFAQKNPEHYVNWLSGKYTDCKQEGGEDILTKGIKVCDEYKQLKEKSCKVGRLIQVDAKHKYECIRERRHYEKTCEQKLKLTCKDWEEGIIFKSEPWIGRKFNKIDAKSLYQINVEKNMLNSHKFVQPRACKYIKFNGYTVKGIADLDKLQMLVLINGVHIPFKSSGTAQDPFVDTDLKKYLRKENNLFEVEIGNLTCIGSEFLFDYVDKLACKNWDESWEEECA